MTQVNAGTGRPALRRRPGWLVALRWLLLLVLPIGGAAPAWADECGRDGQRACRVDERIPSCDLNLVEGGGRCIRPLCGAEGQRGCGPGERITFDILLQLPMPKVCDADLKHDLFKNRCFHPNCGRENQQACPVTERLPSCDTNLVENAGRCIHPPLCGRAGQAPCAVIARGLARRCDADLVDRAGQCVRPGTPDAATGSTAVATTGGATNAPPPPPPPARTQQPARTPPPPPPPPPARAPTPAVTTAAAQAGAMEPDMDRAGGDMYGFNVAQPDPAMCQTSCAYNAQCVAWTFVKAGVQGPAARCYLKNTAAAPARNTCCVSGAKSAAKSLLQPLR